MIVKPYKVPENLKTIKASYDSLKQWKVDLKGYFTIKVFYDEGLVKMRYCNYQNEVLLLVEGKTALELFNTIVREELIGSLQHATYLGAELQKAQIALELKLVYVQDEELDFSKKHE